jgi:hypothetical protein
MAWTRLDLCQESAVLARVLGALWAENSPQPHGGVLDPTQHAQLNRAASQPKINPRARAVGLSDVDLKTLRASDGQPLRIPVHNPFTT